MAQEAISSPIVRINGEQYPIVPNTLKYSAGRATTTVRAADAGDGATESIHSRNAEDATGKVSFELYVTTGLDSTIATLSNAVGQNVIEFSESLASGASATRSFVRMSLVNDPEVNPTADGTVSLEFAGDPMVMS